MTCKILLNRSSSASAATVPTCNACGLAGACWPQRTQSPSYGYGIWNTIKAISCLCQVWIRSVICDTLIRCTLCSSFTQIDRPPFATIRTALSVTSSDAYPSTTKSVSYAPARSWDVCVFGDLFLLALLSLEEMRHFPARLIGR